MDNYLYRLTNGWQQAYLIRARCEIDSRKDGVQQSNKPSQSLLRVVNVPVAALGPAFKPCGIDKVAGIASIRADSCKKMWLVLSECAEDTGKRLCLPCSTQLCMLQVLPDRQCGSVC